MVPLYRLKILPLFGLGKIFLLLITKGRITDKKRRTPLEYHRINGVITIFSARGEESGWMKNILKNPLTSTWRRSNINIMREYNIIWQTIFINDVKEQKE